MKNLIVVFILLNSSVCLAQDAVTKQTEVSPEDAAKIKAGMESLSKALGVPEQVKKEENSGTQTLGLAANKIADVASQVVAQLSATIHKIAPEVWRVMIRQQYAKAASGLIPPLVWFFIALTFRLVIPKLWNKPKVEGSRSEDENAWWVVIVVLFPMCLVIAGTVHLALNLTSCVQYVINPEFYAIRDLLVLMTKPSILLN